MSLTTSSVSSFGEQVGADAVLVTLFKPKTMSDL